MRKNHQHSPPSNHCLITDIYYLHVCLFKSRGRNFHLYKSQVLVLFTSKRVGVAPSTFIMGYVNQKFFFRDVYPENVAQPFAYNLQTLMLHFLAMNPPKKIRPRGNILVQDLLHRLGTCVGMPQTSCFKRTRQSTQFKQDAKRRKHHPIPFSPSAMYPCHPARTFTSIQQYLQSSPKVRLPRSSSQYLMAPSMRLCPKNIQPERNPSKQQGS